MKFDEGGRAGRGTWINIFKTGKKKNGWRLEAGKENYDTWGSEILGADWWVFLEVNSWAAHAVPTTRSSVSQSLADYRRQAPLATWKQFSFSNLNHDLNYKQLLKRILDKYSVTLSNF